jgi:uncharacterized PurR-regulated membrane protein YhhQ (DUF165 family)
MKLRFPFVATISYIAFIVLLNTAIVYWPPIHVFSQPISPADAFVGCIYLVRDFAQREIRHYVFIAMMIGAALSFFLASHAIAMASVSAFIVGELIDWAIYTYTKKPLSQRLMYSALMSAPMDTVIFLVVLDQLNWAGFLLMNIGKITGVFILWMMWKMRTAKKQSSSILLSA